MMMTQRLWLSPALACLLGGLSWSHDASSSAQQAPFARGLNARDFGAKGDGKADDAPALQRAVDAGQRLGHAVFIPAGLYLLNSTLIVRADFTGRDDYGVPGDGQHNSSLRLQGEGMQLTQLRAVSAMTSVLSFARGPGFEAGQAEQHEVTDLLLNGSNIATYGVNAPGICRTIFSRVHVFGSVQAGFLMYGWINRIEQCQIEMCGQALVTNGEPNNIIVRDNWIEGMYRTAIEVAGGMNVVIQGNTIEGCGGPAIVAWATDTLVIENNYFESNNMGRSCAKRGYANWVAAHADILRLPVAQCDGGNCSAGATLSVFADVVLGVNPAKGYWSGGGAVSSARIVGNHHGMDTPAYDAANNTDLNPAWGAYLLIAARGVDIRDNSCSGGACETEGGTDSGPPPPLLVSGTNAELFDVRQVRVQGNTGWSKVVALIDVNAHADYTPPRRGMLWQSLIADGIRKKNFIEATNRGVLLNPVRLTDPPLHLAPPPLPIVTVAAAQYDGDRVVEWRGNGSSMAALAASLDIGSTPSLAGQSVFFMVQARVLSPAVTVALWADDGDGRWAMGESPTTARWQTSMIGQWEEITVPMTMPLLGNNTRFAIHVSGACPPCDDLHVQFRAVALAPIGAGPVWEAMKSDDDETAATFRHQILVGWEDSPSACEGCVSLAIDDSVARIGAHWKQHQVPSLLDLSDAQCDWADRANCSKVFIRGFGLADGWHPRLMKIIDTVIRPEMQSGALAGVFIDDESCRNMPPRISKCWPDYSVISHFLHAQLPQPIFYLNEGAINNDTWSEIQQLPSNLTYFSVDHYDGFLPSEQGVDEVDSVRKYYTEFIFPRLPESASVFTVPGIFACSNVSVMSLATSDEHVAAKLVACRQWATEEPRLAGFMGWHLTNRSLLHHQHAPLCDQNIGAVALPLALKQLQAIGSRLKVDDPWAQCLPNMDTTAAGVPGWRGYKLAWSISTNGFGSESRENLSGLWTISPSNTTDTLYPTKPTKRGKGLPETWPSNASLWRWDKSSSKLILGNLSWHVQVVKQSLVGTMEKGFRGLAVLDYESPRPLWDTYLNEWEAVQVPYRERVRELAAAAHPTWSTKQIEAASRTAYEDALKLWLLATLGAVRQHAPHSLAGFYGFPERYTDPPFCETAERRRLSDQLMWMFNASSAVFPSVYLLYEGGIEVPVEFNAEYIRSNTAAAVRVAQLDQPVWAYSMFYYHTSRLHKESAQHNVSGQGHGDLREEFLGAYQAGASGTVVWGNDADRGADTRSEIWAGQLHTVAKDFFAEQCNCSFMMCQQKGKCIFDLNTDENTCQPFKSDDDSSAEGQLPGEACLSGGRNFTFVARAWDTTCDCTWMRQWERGGKGQGNGSVCQPWLDPKPPCALHASCNQSSAANFKCDTYPNITPMPKLGYSFSTAFGTFANHTVPALLADTQKMPSGHRTIMMYDADVAIFDTLGDRVLLHVDDTECADPPPTTCIPIGSLCPTASIISPSFAAVFWDGAVAARRAQSMLFFPAFREAGGHLDELTQDSEETSWGMRIPDPPSHSLPAANRSAAFKCIRARWNAIQADARFPTLLPALQAAGFRLPNLGDTTALSDLLSPFSASAEAHRSLVRDAARVTWNAAMVSRMSQYWFRAFGEVALKSYPKLRISNFGLTSWSPEYCTPGMNGGVVACRAGTGSDALNSQAPAFYFGASVEWQCHGNSSDATRDAASCRNNPGIDVALNEFDGVPFGDFPRSGFNMMLLHLHSARGMVLAKPAVVLRPWLAMKSFAPREW
jgi:hypothetical protein